MVETVCGGIVGGFDGNECVVVVEIIEDGKTIG